LGRGSGRYLSYLMDSFKKKNNVSLIAGMDLKKTLSNIAVHHPHMLFEVPVYQGRADVKDNVLLSRISDAKFEYLINVFTKETLRVHRNKPIDIIHTNHCSFLPYSSHLVKDLVNVPYVVMAHGTGIISSLQSKRNFKIAKIGLENADYIMANSRFVRNQIIKHFRIKPSKVKVVYLGVDSNEFKPIAQKENIKKKYKCDGKKLVYSTGFFTEEKGFQDMIMAAKILEKKDKDIVTLISGKGPYEGKLQNMIKRLKLKRTRIIGWIQKEDLRKIYSAAHLFIIPSRWDEPFGMVTIEAMSSGTPVIGTNTGGTPEIITKKTGALVPPKNPKQMAETILDKINNKTWLEKAPIESRKLVRRKFRIDIMCKSTEKVYNKVLNL
jgi:glycosyltransferase involved in cell wall biosynthesis